MSDDFIYHPTNRVVRLKNLTCAYCGERGSNASPLTVEHVIGRRFVPKGSLAGGWNLILNACRACNAAKSDLEDDISAITLQPNLQDRHEDPALASEAARKAQNAMSRMTRKPVADSHATDSVEGTIFGAVKFTANYVSPPQIAQDRAHRLAWLHLQGFIYMMSYDSETRQGRFIPGDVGFVCEARKPDWGNELIRGFADLTKDWPVRLICECAQGFFKVVMRKHPAKEQLCSFALEWNANYRLIGFFGDTDTAQELVNALPELKWKRVDATRRMREEIPIKAEDDTFFATPELADRAS